MKFIKKSIYIVIIISILITFSILIKNNTSYSSEKSSIVNDTARFLAGKDLTVESQLFSYTKSKYYDSYKKEIKVGWNAFQQPNIAKIKKWWQMHAPKKYNSTVLYPFSGPDIMNALTFFPDAEMYIMFGLETPGIIPDPYHLSNDKISEGLAGVKKSINAIMKVNFFRTNNMARELKNNSFNSITGILLFFLAMNDYEIVDVKKIVIDAESNVVIGNASDDKISWQNPPKSRIPGVEISFKKGSEKKQRLRYYMLNVIDHALHVNSPNFIPYLNKQGTYTTIIKSASYLMHNDKVKFTKIRAAILANSDYIVQDDSGIPLRYFSPKKWTLKFHGFYDKPIPLFKHRIQQDYKEAMKKYSTGILPFSYGYDYLEKESNIMTAEKIK